MTVTLAGIDLVIIGAYFAGVMAIGFMTAAGADVWWFFKRKDWL